MRRRRIPLSGQFLVLLALVAQLGWNARLPDMPRMELAALLRDSGAICHSGGGAGGKQSPGMPDRDCPMCPCCIGTLLPAAQPVPIVCVPLPEAVSTAQCAVTPPAIGPPPVRFAIARPRGPPAQA